MKQIISGAILAAAMTVQASAVERQTFVYDIAGTDTLCVDLYRGESMPANAPAVIFAFGGGFTHGSRDDVRYQPMFNFLADNGVAVVSADYRTMLAKANPADLADVEDFAEALSGAIQVAVLDFTRATAFTLSKADDWGVDTSRIFAAGSSAGAITVLQTAYESANRNAAVGALPQNFAYAGVISMAGAVLSDGTPRWRSTPAPMMLFHGDADSTVPFDRATVGSFGLFGSKSIAESLMSEQYPCTFWKICGADHSVAISPMDNHCGAILDFIRAVCRNRATITTVEERQPNQKPYKTDFTLGDYIRSNLGN